jgi:serine/threonine protein phosphatase PrpC
MLRFIGAGVCVGGPVRDLNEDSAFLGPHLVLVADGVGGAAAGEIASATTAYAVCRGIGRGVDPLLALDAGLRRAADLLTRASAADQAISGLATTLTAIATDGQRVALAHAGDSRAYLVRAGGLTRLTRDHTYVQQLLDDGFLAVEAVERHPWRHVVTRSVRGGDVDDEERPEFLELALAPGDRLVLGTDGLTDHLADGLLAEIAASGSAAEVAQTLVDAAFEHGSTDNVTCLVADVVAVQPLARGVVERDAGLGERFGAFADDSNVIGATRLTAY